MQLAILATHVLLRNLLKIALLELLTHVILATHAQLKLLRRVRILAILATLATHVLQRAKLITLYYLQ